MSTVGSVSAAARPARMRAISLVLKHKAIEIVTNGSLVSRLLGEVMLSCKDPSKKTRDAAFEALVSVAKASEVAGVSSEHVFISQIACFTVHLVENCSECFGVPALYRMITHLGCHIKEENR